MSKRSSTVVCVLISCFYLPLFVLIPMFHFPWRWWCIQLHKVAFGVTVKPIKLFSLLQWSMNASWVCTIATKNTQHASTWKEASNAFAMQGTREMGVYALVIVVGRLELSGHISLNTSLTQSNLILPKQFWQKRARLNSNTEKNRNRHVADQVQHSQKPTYFLPVHTWQVR